TKEKRERERESNQRERERSGGGSASLAATVAGFSGEELAGDRCAAVGLTYKDDENGGSGGLWWKVVVIFALFLLVLSFFSFGSRFRLWGGRLVENGGVICGCFG
ncbi:hypothetical protein A2U01_0020934, partial [Trifolium medium]|nr:hypothetical protein [Trifolium medium]